MTHTTNKKQQLQEFEQMESEIEQCWIKVSLLEAAMVKKIREEAHYGTFVVTKQKGQPRRVVIQGSEILTEEEGLGLSAESLAGLEEVTQPEDNSV